MIKNTKQRLVLSIERDKVKEMKIKAIQSGMTLSDLVSKTVCEVTPFMTETIPLETQKPKS